MSEILVKRVQYPVGQGGFHMVDMMVRGKPFRYIYDCGSSTGSAIEAVLKNLDRSTEEKEMDWLVISSFDMDHFNGVKLLIENGYTFEKIFLPHALDKDLLVWLMCLYLQDGRSIDAIRGALVNLHALHHIKAQPRKDIDGQNRRALLEPAQEHQNGPAGMTGSVYYMQHADWMFRFYSLETNFTTLVAGIFARAHLVRLRRLMEQAADTLIGNADVKANASLIDDIAKELLRVPRPRAARSPAPPAAGATSGTAAGATSGAEGLTVKKILEAAFKEIKDKKRRVFMDYNAASRCLYSGPRTGIGRHHSQFTVECTLGNSCPHPVRDATRRVGWLATGDMGFPNQKLLDQFALYYGAELALACTKMVPHHGANSSYGSGLPMLQAFYLLDTNRPLWVAAASPTATYGHPDATVVAACRRHGSFALVSDVPRSRIEETIRSEATASDLRYLVHEVEFLLSRLVHDSARSGLR